MRHAPEEGHKGRSCGPGVYAPSKFIEQAVVKKLRQIAAHCTNPEAFAPLGNEELASLDAQEDSPLADVDTLLTALDPRIARVRQAIEDGLEDVAWANQRLGELNDERTKLLAERSATGQSREKRIARRKVTAAEAMALRREIDKPFEVGTIEEKKQLLRIGSLE